MTHSDRTKALARLLQLSPTKRVSEAARVVATHRSLIRRAMRRGHSLQTLATELRLPKNALRRQLNLAGLFFRQPRSKKGVVIRPYKPRQKAD